jgi:Fe-S-cluster containining protein
MSRDRTVHCHDCDAVCCRLTVVLSAEDVVPSAYVVHRGDLDLMAHGEDGWCLALDRERMCCSIYAQRPAACRRFSMGGPYCLAERAAYAAGSRRIPIVLIG